MIPYNTKFWTVSPEKLTCEWLKGFIPRPTLNEVIEGTIEDSPRQFGYNAHFWYPKKGPIQELPLAFRKRLKNVHTGCEASRIDLKKKILVFSNGSECRYDILISTIPLPELAVLIKDMPLSVLNAFKKLRWNSVFNLNLGLRQKVRCDKHWIYFPQRDLSFFRVGFYHNFSSNLSAAADSSIYAEVSYSKEKPVDKKILPSRIRKDLISTGIISSSDRVKAQDINDIKYAYPIYDRDYSRARKRVLDFLSRNRMIPCGRFGSWRYMSMEDVIMDGKGVAAKAQEMCG
jgi:protoporphyrinogen oxidase